MNTGITAIDARDIPTTTMLLPIFVIGLSETNNIEKPKIKLKTINKIVFLKIIVISLRVISSTILLL